MSQLVSTCLNRITRLLLLPAALYTPARTSQTATSAAAASFFSPSSSLTLFPVPCTDLQQQFPAAPFSSSLLFPVHCNFTGQPSPTSPAGQPLNSACPVASVRQTAAPCCYCFPPPAFPVRPASKPAATLLSPSPAALLQRPLYSTPPPGDS
ncbi:hypothetical protein AAC387_Pa12g0363 [Persea americana]